MSGSLCHFALFHSLIEYICVSRMVTLDPGYFSTILIISLYFLVVLPISSSVSLVNDIKLFLVLGREIAGTKPNIKPDVSMLYYFPCDVSP